MRSNVYKETFIQTLFLPIRAFFQGQDDNPKYFDGKLNPFLLLLPLLAFIGLGNNRLRSFKHHRNVFAVFSILFILFVFFKADFRIRYMAPAIPPLIVLSVFGLKTIVHVLSGRNWRLGITGKIAATFIMLMALALNINYVYGLFGTIRPLDYISGKIDRDSYISIFRKEYPTIQYANKYLPEDAIVLCLSIGDRTYYVDRPVHLSESFYKRKNGKYSDKELLISLRKFGTTHIIINQQVFINWIRNLSKSDQSMFLNVFKSNTKTLYRENDILLLELPYTNPN